MTADLTYAEVAGFLARVEAPDSTSRLGETVTALQGLRLPPGSVVLIALPNGMSLLDAFFGTLLAGHVPTLLASSTPTDRLAVTVRQLGAAALVRRRLAAGPEYRDATVLPGMTIAQCAGNPLIQHRSGQAILMTSGTSGAGTGCLHDLSALARNALRHLRAIGQQAHDTVLVSLPMYYSYAIVAQILGSLYAGSRVVVGTPPFTGPHYHERVSRASVTVSALTPLLVRALMAHSDRLPARLRRLGVGGDALDPGLVQRLLDANPDLELYLTYGLTEAGPRVSTLAAHDEPPGRYASVGRPLEGVTLSTRPAPSGTGAELVVTSDTVYLGRVGAPGCERLLSPGTVATGDLAHLDDDGYLTLRGRLTDFVLVGGEKVSLTTVRRAAEVLPGVVRAVATLDAEQDRLRLDLYVSDAWPFDLDAARRRLGRTLIPAERPGRLAVHPAGLLSQHK